MNRWGQRGRGRLTRANAVALGARQLLVEEEQVDQVLPPPPQALMENQEAQAHVPGVEVPAPILPQMVMMPADEFRTLIHGLTSVVERVASSTPTQQSPE